MRGPAPNRPTSANRFKSQLRHYHRSGVQQRTWDEWVDAGKSGKRRRFNWPLLLGSILGSAILISIIAGLAIELS